MAKAAKASEAAREAAGKTYDEGNEQAAKSRAKSDQPAGGQELQWTSLFSSFGFAQATGSCSKSVRR